MCGRLTGDGHAGTDLAIRSLAEMRRGVAVLAAAEGRVAAVRDGMADRSVDAAGRATIQGRECGNGVLVEHGQGWQTQYCHLRKGSLAVRPGDVVAAGQKLGLVGLSGETSYPHLHLSVRRGGQEVDPFRGLEGGPACGLGTAPLWAPEVLERLAYRPLLLTDAGLTDARPDWVEVQEGGHAAATLPATAPLLALWLEAFALEPGDLLNFFVTGPAGEEVLAERRAEAKGQARAFRFVGRKAPAGGWPPGRYLGRVTLERAGETPVALERAVELR
jgi:murein DD-endopeptidase MepM/ murein hydrolase activator NlpD